MSLVGASEDDPQKDLPKIDVQTIMQEIREGIATRKGVMAAFTDSVASDVAALRTYSDVYYASLQSRRRLLSPLITFARKIARRALTPSLARQVSYNVANAKVLNTLRENCEVLANHQSRLVEELTATHTEALDTVRRQLDELGLQQAELSKAQTQAVHELRSVVDSLSEATKGLRQKQLDTTAQLEQRRVETEAHAQILERLQNELRDHMATRTKMASQLQAEHERVARTERKLRRLLQTAANGDQNESEGSQQGSVEPDEAPLGFDYLGFEERFRGSEEDVKERQQPYLDYFRGCSNVLDIGCGRGEFLELLRGISTEAKGVDGDLDMVLYCREKGLDVERSDVFAYLETQPDESLGGIFCAQVIEHFPPIRIIRLVKLCKQKLRPGAYLIMETVNPACLMTFAASFYADLTHVRPIHPETMRFLLEVEGFPEVAVKFSAPVDASRRMPELPQAGGDFNRGINYLNDLLYGHQEYAVIGRRGFSASAAG